MYAMIHSAEIVHHQQAAELTRNLERARIRSERSQYLPAAPRPSARARFASAFRLHSRTAGAARSVVSAH